MKTASWFTFFGAGRVGISRGIPRNIAAGHRSFRGLAPGPWFKSVTPAEFIRRYDAEILARLDPQATWELLHSLAAPDEPVLLCWERPPFTGKNWCHRRLAAEWFEASLGVEVAELGAAGDEPETLDLLGLRVLF